MPTEVKLVIEEKDESEPESDSAGDHIEPAPEPVAASVSYVETLFGINDDGNDDGKADEEAQRLAPPQKVGDSHGKSSFDSPQPEPKANCWARAKVWIVNNVNPKFRNYSR